jgi:hypothetical protein
MTAQFTRLGRMVYAIVIVANYALSTRANAQNASQNEPKQVRPAGLTCPGAADVTPLHLYGLWRAEFDGQAPGATLLFEKHPELAGSVSGAINRDGSRTLLAGDVDDGAFTLEESGDGQNISATWSGAVVEGSCGKEISGTWSRTGNSKPRRFVLRKVPGWQ